MEIPEELDFRCHPAKTVVVYEPSIEWYFMASMMHSLYKGIDSIAVAEDYEICLESHIHHVVLLGDHFDRITMSRLVGDIHSIHVYSTRNMHLTYPCVFMNVSNHHLLDTWRMLHQRIFDPNLSSESAEELINADVDEELLGIQQLIRQFFKHHVSIWWNDVNKAKQGSLRDVEHADIPWFIRSIIYRHDDADSCYIADFVERLCEQSTIRVIHVCLSITKDDALQTSKCRRNPGLTQYLEIVTPYHHLSNEREVSIDGRIYRCLLVWYKGRIDRIQDAEEASLYGGITFIQNPKIEMIVFVEEIDKDMFNVTLHFHARANITTNFMLYKLAPFSPKCVNSRMVRWNQQRYWIQGGAFLGCIVLSFTCLGKSFAEIDVEAEPLLLEDVRQLTLSELKNDTISAISGAISHAKIIQLCQRVVKFLGDQREIRHSDHAKICREVEKIARDRHLYGL